MSDVNYGISNVGTVMTSCAGTQHLTPYHAKLERVKFGVPLEQVCRPEVGLMLDVTASLVVILRQSHFCVPSGSCCHPVIHIDNRRSSNAPRKTWRSV